MRATLADPAPNPAAKHLTSSSDASLPYTPFRQGDPLPSATLPPPDQEVLEPLGPSYARRRLQPLLGLSMLPLVCAERQSRCKSYTVTAGLALRPEPHFAWSLTFERSTLPSFSVHYLALGARVYALDAGTFDPYLELNLGAEHWSHAPRLNVAVELSFGLGLHIAEHVQLGPSVNLRHGQQRSTTCDEYGAACQSWSSMGERWLEAGLMLHFPLGQRH
jgi:hypothetical protein